MKEELDDIITSQCVKSKKKIVKYSSKNKPVRSLQLETVTALKF